MLPPSGRSLPRMTGRDNLRGRNEQSQQAPAYNRTSRVAAWNEQRLQASATQARVALPSGMNSSPSGPAPDEEPWHLQQPLYRDHSGFPITRGMMERSVRESRLRFSDNFTQMDIPCAGSPEEEDQEEDQPRLDEPRLDEPRLDQSRPNHPRPDHPRLEQPRLEQQCDGEARAETPSNIDQPHTHESQAGYQSRRRDPEYIREVQAPYQVRHYQEYTRRLRTERQPRIEQHDQGVESQNQSRRTPQQLSEFQTEVQGSRVQRYPQQVQAEYRSHLNEEHHSESQAVRQAPQASHFQQYPRVLRGQNQTRVRQPYQSHFHAAHQPRQAANAQQYPQVLRGQSQPRVRQHYSPHFRGPLHQARHVRQYHQGYQSEYQTPDEQHDIPGREISLAEALRMDSSPAVVNPSGGFNVPAGYNRSAGHNPSVGVNSADGFNGNPLVTIIPPAPETKPTSLESRTSNSHPMMLEGENGAKNEKKKKIQEIKEKAKEAKTWLLKSARDGYSQRGL